MSKDPVLRLMNALWERIDEARETAAETLRICAKLRENTMENLLEKARNGVFANQGEASEALTQAAKAAVKKSNEPKSVEQFVADFIGSEDGAEFYLLYKALDPAPIEEPEPEPVFKRGPVYGHIEKRAQQLVDTGEAPTLAQGFDLAVSRDPELWISFCEERLAG
ncbi:hypothetical protein MYX78_03685 [Acidobacteria bacterium AH-259-G07]|nr:hypothetical protein [Acidobacteria bacterium AH-259-G07]